MINALITKLRDEQEEIKHALVQYPDVTTYERNVGKWMGLQKALDVLDDILKGAEDAQ